MNKRVSGIIAFFMIITGSLSAGGGNDVVHETVDYVDMERFSGDWYVIALIPTPFEEEAVHGVENYSVDEKGIIRVEYTFRKKTTDGKIKTMYQKGWIENTRTNAEWRVRPVWPLKLPYFILELGNEYDYTVIGTDNFDYLWIMDRAPIMDSALLENIIRRMEERGYNPEAILMMDQTGRNP